MAIEGVVDRVTNEEVEGWVYRDDDPVEHLLVTVHLRGADIGSNIANRFREDLKEAAIGEGDHGYRVRLDRPIEGDELRELTIRASSRGGQHFELSLPAQEVQTEAPAAASKTTLEDTLLELQSMKPYAGAAELMPPIGYPRDLMIDDGILAEWAASTKAAPRELRERVQRDTAPIPHPHNREGYAGGDDLAYWLSGYADYKMIQELGAAYGVVRGRYFDFGGSTGRVFRHFALQSNVWDVWSSDFKISSVEFNLKYFPSSVRVFLNTSFPPLPLPGDYFDLVSACSVLTHIDEAETSWLLELRRILRVGGIACISIHSKETWARMTGTLRDNVSRFRPDIAGNPELPEGKTVVTFRHDDPYRCHTFHSDQYIERNWGRFFEICEIRPMVLGLQAMVVCRRVD